ncbi:MAG: MBL fold metallo-hydrolase [Deltaproteobacteria bacterium]|nr:MBL fold metallo-hydrolase [Deltaproteobacteria bacterium]
MDELDLIRLADGFFVIAAENNGRFPFSHGFLVTGETTAVIDAGFGHGRIGAVIKKYRPDLLIVSHSHPDHLSGAGLFAGRPILVPEIHAEAAGNVMRLSQRFITGDAAEAWRRSAYADFDFRECVPTGTYGDGHVFDFGRIKLRAVHAPGHVDDHFCFSKSATVFFLSIDIDLTGFGPWYGNPESDIRTFRASVRKVKDLEAQTIASSHRRPVSDDIEDELAAFDAKFDRNEKLVLDLLATPRTLDDLADAKPFYRVHPRRETILRYFEMQMIGKHLDMMEEKRLVRRDGGVYRLA